MPHKSEQSKLLAISAGLATVAILLSILAGPAAAQSTKGGQAAPAQQLNRGPTGGYSAAASPAAQVRQQQQQQQLPQQQQQPSYSSSRTTGSPTARTRRPTQQVTQQPASSSYGRTDEATEDPLSDSEPALYGSVAGQPGVDFPGYTRIPKTSFTCEGKGFDFGFYADEEAGCQVYHVCWSGRRESFLCGVGTVFNQAILACDYWHSVDCSKSSQFYGVNSELGKAGAEPSSNSGPQRQSARVPATLPAQQTNLNYGDSLSGNPKAPRQQQQQPQQVQYSVNDDSNFDSAPQQVQTELSAPVQQVQVQVQSQPQQQVYGTKNDRQPASQQPQQGAYGAGNFVPQRSQSTDWNQQPVKSANQRVNQPAPVTTTPAAAVKRPRFNMDFNQKVNSLIESPVRPPIKSVVQQQQPGASKSRGAQQVAQRPANFAQLAVARAQQSGSQNLNAGPARKTPVQAAYQQQQVQVQPQVAQQRQSGYDGGEQDSEPQQQQGFDDSPVQTSTAQSSNYAPTPGSRTPSSAAATPTSGAIPQQQQYQQQQIVVHAGGNSPDGSSAITTQYDTLTPAGVQGAPTAGGQNLNNQQQQQQSSDSAYDGGSSLDDSSSNSSEDFRASGAKAAASHNQNWYIMRSI